MATFMYNSARGKFANKQLDWDDASVIKAALVGAAYSPLRTHNFVSDLTSIVARSGEMTTKVNTSGICKGDIPEFSALLSATEIVGLVIYIDTGSDATSQLLYYSSDGPGFPFTAAGLNYFVGYDQANGGFFEV